VVVDLEMRMTIKTLARKGVSNRAIARQLGISEGTVRYQRRRLEAGGDDGRARQQRLAARYRKAIDHWLGQQDEEAGLNLVALHDWLAQEHGYGGSLRSVQRFVGETYPAPRRRARRRIETPPGAQAQADWATFPRLVVAGRETTLHAFHLVLSHSRGSAIVWAPRQDLLCWLDVHNEALRRLGGVPAVLRVDNTKTALVRGAGPWGTLNESYRRYAATLRFHIDPCLPRAQEHKGKVERAVLTQRLGADPGKRLWDSVEALQAWSDHQVERQARSRRCPATGTTVWEAWQAERRCLGPLPAELPRPFDAIATRRVGADALVHFEGRQYSVPFRYVGERLEVRGTAEHVEIWAEGSIVAEHPRRTAARLVLQPEHYEGPSTDRVQAPTPLGRLGRRLEELASMPVEHRPIDLYAALAEVAR
jgi:transposase